LKSIARLMHVIRRDPIIHSFDLWILQQHIPTRSHALTAAPNMACV
jgi:hypothetical protein